MESQVNTQVHFYSKHDTFVSFETFVQGRERSFAEVVTLCSFALRQMHNLSDYAVPLARVFEALSGGTPNPHAVLGLVQSLRAIEDHRRRSKGR